MVSLTDNTSFRLPSSRLQIVKKALYHPLTFLALGLHALLLVMPMAAEPAAEPEAAEEVPEEVAVDVLNLSDIATSTPPSAKPASPASGAPSAPLPPGAGAIAPRSSASPVNYNPVNYSPPAASQPRSTAVFATTSPAAGIPTGPAAGIPVGPAATGAVPAGGSATGPVATAGGGGSATGPAVTASGAQPQPTYDPAQEQGVFITGLQSLGVQDNTDAVGLPSPNALRRPAGYNFFLDNNTDPINPQPIPQAKSARWLEAQTSELFTQLQNTYAQSNIVFNQLDDYGGESLYELQNSTGQVVMYISLVDLKGSSLLVMWNSKP